NFFTLHKHDEQSSLFTKLKSLGKFTITDVENIMTDPSKRDWQVNQVEMAALKQRNEKFPDRTLVFGHTHVPFFDSNDRIVNSGSWVSNDNKIPFNTFIEIKEGEIQLKQVIANNDNQITSIADITHDYTRKVGSA
ncbi:MAG: hypothetical protein ACREBJ_08050, partial [Nitrosotalea sp.]